MSNKSRNLKRIISTLCSFAAVTGAGAKDVSESSKGNANRPVVSSSSVKRNDQSFVGNLIDKIQRNKGKSLAIGASVAAGIGGGAYVIKKVVDKNKEGKDKEGKNEKSRASVNTINTNEQAVAKSNSNEIQQLQAAQNRLKAELKSEQGARNIMLLLNDKLDENKNVIAMKRMFGESQNSRFSSRDNYIANKLNALGFASEGLSLNATNCSVFDLANNNYSVYVFDFNGKVPDGAKDLVREIPGMNNMYYALGKGNIIKGSSLVNPRSYNVTISKSNSNIGSLAYNLSIDMTKL